jgi:hypothetical protein
MPAITAPQRLFGGSGRPECRFPLQPLSSRGSFAGGVATLRGEEAEVLECRDGRTDAS